MRLLVAGLALATTLCLGACAEMSQVLQSGAGGMGTAGNSNQSTLSRAVKESLELSSTRAADLLSKTGAYQNSSLYRIRLPEPVQPIASRLRQFGLGGQVDQIEKLMNQGAEHAAVEAKGIFIGAVRSMTLTDAMGIVRGNDTAATAYFRQHTETELRQKYLPIIQSNLRQIGFYNQYQQLLSAYKQLPLTNKPDLDLEQHVLTQSLNALFTQVGEEEKAIRKDPIGRGSSVIAAVFAR
ncbi:hypothetical protein GCM10011487_25680 [Steroidobacter agaridevorans]|uniref:DUF4197 domain-containing protein n=1 Tax=Steroidobacter agaridevorans TaxID=2695856 RepID=A0A829YCK5_9GAMM|nr:DUF4197 domain-containing protein [Steroidobacter agaridevorans]GFE80568.1 hypothetical protein GCM10011487_25680 [Steroidobacter agaridevorans]